MKGALNLKEEYGSAVFNYRALLGRFYESNTFRMFFWVTFEDTEDLMNKIDEIYLRLDEDDSGGLVIEEFRAGLKNMHVKDPITEGYVRRTLRNSVVFSNNQEFHSTIMLIKKLEESFFEKIEGREALTEITSFFRQQQ
jgi:hypothetical protein